MKKLAIISTHPIQYNAPLFRLLATRNIIQIKVFYTWGADVLKDKYDPGFGKSIKWDIPLLEGYEYKFVENIARNKGSHHFSGINNPALIKEIKSWNADAVLVYGWSFKSHLRAMRHFYGKIPVLFRGDSVSLNKPATFYNRLRRMFLRWVYRHIDVALYVGKHNWHYFIENGIEDQKLVFAPHAVDNDRFKQCCHDNRDTIYNWRESLGIEKEDVVLLYAGKMDTNKNVESLAASFRQLNLPGIHLVLAGNGEKEIALKKSFEMETKIHFLPFQNQSKMPLLYGISDIYVLPSLTETWGLAINEAMACGKAILASEGCGCAIDLVKDGYNGYIFRLNNEQDLIDKIKLITADKIKLLEMGNKSDKIIRNWTLTHTAQAIEDSVIRTGAKNNV